MKNIFTAVIIMVLALSSTSFAGAKHYYTPDSWNVDNINESTAYDRLIMDAVVDGLYPQGVQDIYDFGWKRVLYSEHIDPKTYVVIVKIPFKSESYGKCAAVVALKITTTNNFGGFVCDNVVAPASFEKNDNVENYQKALVEFVEKAKKRTLFS